MIVLRPYQDNAVSELYSSSTSLLQKAGNKVIVFRAPTGSGKTIVMAEFLRKLVTENATGLTLSFIWAAPRHLHIQSKDKLERYYYENKALTSSFFEDLTDKNIAENEILFLNWESINKADNIIIRDNENDFNLSSILQNTRDQGRQVILIIDESHFSTKTEIAAGLKDMIDPKLTIEVSATPVFAGDQLVPVDREDVIQDEMIKKYVVINQEFKNDILAKTTGEMSVKPLETTNEFIISEALNKREQLAKEFAGLASNVNPLMLIQLPDRKAGIDDLKDEIAAILKNKHGITVENGKIAIYLSEDKKNLETISINDDKAEVMIFKQAIAIGWDCPRAHILVMLREMHSFVFTVQTVGRILRMPELKHYTSDALNIGYIYTNMPEFTIEGEESLGYIVTQKAERKDIYKNIDLPSVHSKRHREETRLSPYFVSCFLASADELDLKNKIDRDVTDVSRTLMSDVKVEDIDKAKAGKVKDSATAYITDKGYQIPLIQQESEIQHALDLFLLECLEPLYPDPRSMDKMKQAVYAFFQSTYPLEYAYGDARIQQIVLHKSNSQRFRDSFNKAKDLYFATVGKGKSELIPDGDWNIPSALNYSSSYRTVPAKLSIMEPFYQRDNASPVEKDFTNYLETRSKDIEWWYKNGENDATHFAVAYDDKGIMRSFYVDWIVKYKDGKVGLFDTKSGITAETAKSRAEGLYKYIKEQNAKGKNLVGGIVIPHSGSWYYNDNETYEYDKTDLKSWEFLP
ncbi:DEAD/DEAH box helicase [Chloroflexota bacterium]